MKYVAGLGDLLSKAVGKSCDQEVGIVFSGGIDSTLIAMIATEHTEVTAYSCGITGSADLEYMRDCRDLGFEIKTIEINEDEIEKSLPKIIKAIKNTNPVKVSVEIPFHFTSRKAQEDGLKVMLCGQGSDELFGGYNRYLNALPDYEKVGEMIRKDVENIHTDQLKNDITVCKLNNIELRAPFINPELKEYALEIPLELKIHEMKDTEEFTCIDYAAGKKIIRKYILRKLARELGIPEPIINRKKKAAQYGSGTWKTLEKIAKQRNFKEKARKTGRKDYVRMFLENMEQ